MSAEVLIAKREWAWAAAATLLVVALSLLPFLNAEWNAPEGYVFSGALVTGRDANSYFAKMRQGYAGGWLFRLPYTTEPQKGIVFFTLYFGLGHLARATGVGIVPLFHAARLAGGVLLLLSLYRLAAELAPGVAARRWMFGSSAFASGLGFYLLFAGRGASVDLTVPEANNFYSILANPHFSLAAAAAIWGLLAVFGKGSSAWRRWLVVVVAGLLLVQWSMVLAPALWGALAAGAAAVAWHGRQGSRSDWRRTVALAVALLLVTGAGALLYYLASRRDPVVAAWTAQNQTPSPPVWDYLTGFGVLLPLAAVGAWRNRVEGNALVWALAGWVVAVAALVYFPHPLQRRFAGGMGVPLGLLAGLGLWDLIARARRRGRLALVGGALLVAAPTNLVLLLALLRAPQQLEPYTYLTAGEQATLDWLGLHAAEADVVLASPEMGNFVPAYSAARVVYGHPFETIGARRKEAEVLAYLRGAGGPDAAADLLRRYGVSYVLLGPRERALAGGASPWLPASATRVFQTDGVDLWELAHR